MKMKTKELLLFVILFLCLQISIVSAVDPIVENADAVWNSSLDTTPTDLTNTVSTALPRPLIEYPNTAFNFELKECPEELIDNANKALPRPLIEYPNTALNFELKECPEELTNNVSKALPRPLVEYPNTVFGFELKECPEELANNASKTLPRPLVEYPNTVLSKSLTFPKELMNDSTPPIITNVTVTNITDNSATIKWDTYEFANSIVKYGLSAGVYTKQEYDELFVKTHSVSLCDFFPGTKYYFIVKSDDRSENSAESSEYSFTTAGVPNTPIVSISTDKNEYTADETMSINITLSNPTEVGQPVYFAWRLDLPDYDLQYWIMTEEMYLPQDYEETFAIPFTLGDYGVPFSASWYVALANTATYEIISEDTADWRYSFTTQDLGVKAANRAKQVVNSPYLWGGKGWNWNPAGGWKWEEGHFVRPENGYPSIKGGYYYYSPTMGKVEFGKGLDCSGLSFWAFNKAAGTSEYPSGKSLDYECPVYYERAHGQWTDKERLSQLPKNTPIDKLKPGDLLFFDTDKNGQMDHVIMYVGDGDVVHAEGVIYDKIVEEKLDTVLERYTDYFGGYGRVKTIAMERMMPEEIAKTVEAKTLLEKAFLENCFADLPVINETFVKEK